MRRTDVRISLGMPVYNAAAFLEEALASLLGQTYGGFELIISDNGSTDRTREICESYAARDSRIRYHRSETNRGATWNFHRVFELSSGEYFKWAAHDDLCAPTLLERCVEVLDRDPGVVLCHSRTTIIDRDGNRLKNYKTRFLTDAPEPHLRFRSLSAHHHPCFQYWGLFRASTLRGTPLLGRYSAADFVFLAEVSLRGRFYEIPEHLFFSRWHSGQSTVVYRCRSVRAAWFDPAKQGRLAFPEWRVQRELLRAVRQSPIGVREKTLCALSLARLWVRRRRKLLIDLQRAAAFLRNRREAWKGRPVGFPKTG